LQPLWREVIDLHELGQEQRALGNHRVDAQAGIASSSREI